MDRIKLFKKGFTLSEILITLGIIGVIAAVTLPSVITHFQKQRTVSQLKKVYTILNQAIKLSQIDNDEYKYWNSASMHGKDYFEKYWKPYLKILKYCNSYQDCGYTKDLAWSMPDGTPYVAYGVSNANCNPFLLSDGTLLKTVPNGLIFVDLNAYKGPNKLGRDVFILQVNSAGNIIGHGANSTNNINGYCRPTKAQACAARIIYYNWQIDKNYPW